jgi:chitodextrinase
VFTLGFHRARSFFLILAVLAAVALLAGYVMASPPARADTSPATAGEPATVSSDVLSAPQIDGVVWSQVVVGNTVFAGGSFTTARPAGNAAGVGTVARSNLLAYNLSTGLLISTFAPTINSQVRTLAASPDGSILYIGGWFTRVNGVTRNHVAAFNVATGAVVAGFAPSANANVLAIAPTASTVYLGGEFTAIGSDARAELAAVSATNGAILPWAPTALGGPVNAAVISPDGAKIAIGGGFTTFNGSANPGYGLAMVATTGSGSPSLPFGTNSIVRDGGPGTAFTSLESDGDSLYGTAYDYMGKGNFEGTFRASWADGSITWLEDCHGDTYSAFPVNGIVYVAGHPHNCANIGGFPEVSPRVNHRAVGFTKTVHGVVAKNSQSGYANFGGQPATSMVNWFPDFNVGTYTGQNQGPWSVAGNSQWVVYAGEFTTVNNKPQQGLVRFAVSSIAPNKDGPRVAFSPTATASAPGQVTVSWQADWDRDNEVLTYRIFRNGITTAPVGVVNGVSRFYNRPTMTFVNSGLAPSTSYSYQVQASDPFGNVVNSSVVSVTTRPIVGTNQPPTAAFTATVSGNTVSVNGSASSDPGGSISSYAWNFGDGSTATGVTSTHTFGAPGSYSVTLTVTDNQNATGSVSHSVSTASVAGTTLASDAFGRNLASGWGSADSGGAWSVTGSSSAYTVGSGVGSMTFGTAGQELKATLPTVGSTSLTVLATMQLPQAVTGGSVYESVICRAIGAADYRARAVVATNGAITLQLFRSGTTLLTSNPGVTLAPGDQLNIRLGVVGTSPTLLEAKAWKVGTTEPAAWQVMTTDSTAGLQVQGGVGLDVYISASSTTLPRNINFDNFEVTATN